MMDSSSISRRRVFNSAAEAFPSFLCNLVESDPHGLVAPNCDSGILWVSNAVSHVADFGTVRPSSASMTKVICGGGGACVGGRLGTPACGCGMCCWYGGDVRLFAFKDKVKVRDVDLVYCLFAASLGVKVVVVDMTGCTFLLFVGRNSTISVMDIGYVIFRDLANPMWHWPLPASLGLFRHSFVFRC